MKYKMGKLGNVQTKLKEICPGVSNAYFDKFDNVCAKSPSCEAVTSVRQCHSTIMATSNTV
jgi:hypothetical protein